MGATYPAAPKVRNSIWIHETPQFDRESESRKDRHAGIMRTAKRIPSTSRPQMGQKKEVKGCRRRPTNHLARWFDHRLAILVYQGSDPTPPYQALVIRIPSPLLTLHICRSVPLTISLSLATIASFPKRFSVSMFRLGISSSSFGSPAASVMLSSRSKCSIG
jgi:hypothetical protein